MYTCCYSVRVSWKQHCVQSCKSSWICWIPACSSWFGLSSVCRTHTKKWLCFEHILKISPSNTSMRLTTRYSRLALKDYCTWTYIWTWAIQTLWLNSIMLFSMCTQHCTTWPATSEGNAGRKQADVRMQAGFLKAFSPATGEYLSMAFQVLYALSVEPSGKVTAAYPIAALHGRNYIGCSLVSSCSENSISQNSSFSIKYEWK